MISVDGLIWCSLNKNLTKNELNELKSNFTDIEMLECVDYLLDFNKRINKAHATHYKVEKGYLDLFYLCEVFIYKDKERFQFILNVFDDKEKAEIARQEKFDLLIKSFMNNAMVA